MRRLGMVGALALAVVLPFVGVSPAHAEGIGSITGTVRDQQGDPISGATVRVLDGVELEVVASTVTGLDGSYSLSAAAPRSYEVRFDGPPGAGFVPIYYGGLPAEVGGSSNPVGFRAGEVRGGIDVAMWHQTYLSGSFVDDDGQPIADAPVVAHSPDNPTGDAGWARTDGSGEFRMALRPGDYFLTFDAPGFGEHIFPGDVAFDGDAEPVTVDDGADLSLGAFTVQRLGRVVGSTRVTAPTPQRLAAQYDVYLLRKSQGRWLPWRDVHAGEDGRFEIDAVPGEYRLEYNPDDGIGLLSQYWPGVDDIDHAVSFTVAPEQTVDLGSVRLPDRAMIEGRVTDKAGRPLPGVEVGIESLYGERWHLHHVRTNAAGRYRARGLSGGIYRVLFNSGADPLKGFRRKYWRTSAGPRHAVDLTVHPRQRRQHIDARLPRGKPQRLDVPDPPTVPLPGDTQARVHGTVQDRLHEDIAGVLVGLFARDSRVGHSGWRLIATTRSYRSLVYGGYYRFDNVPAGTYRVGVADDLLDFWAPEFFGGSRRIERARDVVVPDAYIEIDASVVLDPHVRFARTYRMKGRTRVGALLRVRGGAVSPDDVTLVAKWFSAGKRIKAAHGLTYRLRPRDRGHKIKVRLVARRPGMVSRSTTVVARGRVTKSG